MKYYSLLTLALFAMAASFKPLQQLSNTMNTSRKKLILPFLSCLSLAGFSHGAVIAISEGFNSTFTSPYGGQTFGAQFGVTSPGIVADGTNGISATEGNSYAQLNTEATNTVAAIIGAMDISMGTVSAADVGKTLTFTGDFGWTLGTSGSQADIGIHIPQTGFRIGDVAAGGTTVKDSYSNFDFGNHTQNVFEQASFSYTIVNGDIGEAIHLRIRLVDSGANTGLSQLMTDNWVVAIPEPSAALLGGLGALVLLRRRRV